MLLQMCYTDGEMYLQMALEITVLACCPAGGMTISSSL